MDYIETSSDVRPLILTPSDKPCIPYRYKLMVLTFFGFFNACALRINFNIALVAMVNFTSADSMNGTSDECPVYTNESTHTKQGEFSWDADVQGQLQAAFFYGYIFTQFPGGYLAELFGAKIVFGLTSLLSGLLTLLTPTVARWDVNGLLALRVLMGICQGPLYPSNHALWGQWAPTLERSQLTTWSNAGAVLGIVLSSAATGFLCNMEFLGGWPLSFYLFGIISILWFIVWMIFAYDSPKSHPRLSEYERRYIEENNSAASHADDSKALKRPWLAMLKSVPLWAIVIFSLLDGLGYYILYTGVPIYLKQILHYDIATDGVLSSLPFIGMFISALVAGPIADWIRRNKYLSTGATRKLFAFIGEGLIAGFLVAMAFVACDRILAVVMMILAFTINGLGVASQPVNHLDIAPVYAGTLMGISNIFSNMGGFISPIIVSKMTKDQPNRHAWQKTFYLAAGIYSLCTLIWLLFSSGEEQPWAKDPRKNQTTTDDTPTPDFINGPFDGRNGVSVQNGPDINVY